MSGTKEAKQTKKEKEIPICGDGWLAVFDLIAPRQLGLQIALLSHRFDHFVDEHLKTRKWTLGYIQIVWTKEENGNKKMQIFFENQSLPIMLKPLPKNVVGFKHITITGFDQNLIEFLHRFRRLSVSYGKYLAYRNESEFFMGIIWPLIISNICALEFSSCSRSRHFALTILNNNCLSLRLIYIFGAFFFSIFPTDNSAVTLDQALSKWLFTPYPTDGIPKILRCQSFAKSIMDSFKAAFVNASSSVNFIIFITDGYSLSEFELTNHSTEEQMTLKRLNHEHFLLVRCPIARDEQKWDKWEKEVMEWSFHDQWNRITLPMFYL